MTSATFRWISMAAAVVLLAVGASGGYWWAQRSAGRMTPPASSPAPASAEREVLYWYDPMVPDQHFERPGKSPFMDMQLVPKHADEAAGGGVRIDPGLRQSVGIRTAAVEIGRLPSTLRVPGTLAWDMRQESVVSARVDGVVTRLRIKAPYTPVRRGDALVTLLAPGWASAMNEAQALRQARSAMARELQSAAQQRLRVLGIPAGATREGGVTLTAPSTGVVTEVLVREGQAVAPGTPLFRINGLATLWLDADIPQAGVAGLRPGTPVRAVVSAVPGQTFDGDVEALLPQVDTANRTQRARIVLRNPGGVLAPGMFADVELQPEVGAEVALVPTEALIATGTDNRVIVQDDGGGFRPVRVRTGRSGNGRTEILAGLKGGERIVVSGQFLIDSEASLSGALARLEAPEEAMPATEKPALDSPGTTSQGTDAQTGGASLPMHSAALANAPSADASTARRAQATQARSCPVQYWYDPMMPDQHFDRPGKSPFMDMQLVPKFAAGADRDCTVRDVAPTGRAKPRQEPAP